MAEKKIQAPIDRPLARSYLREFSGWSTAYPPGLSDPTSLRTMENVYNTREGATRIRPGIRSVFTEDLWLGTGGETIVGSFEHFVDTDSLRTALLFAVRSSLGVVKFKVFVYNPDTNRFDPKVWGGGGDVFASVSFSSTTTFVKYVQIDNKILALSNDPAEGAILFNVGATKSAKKVPPDGIVINSPSSHTPTIVHPEAAWINDTTKDKVGPPAIGSETPTTGTLIHSTAANNIYSFGFFVTYETEFGETKASEIAVIKTQRGWSQWKFKAPDSSGNDSGNGVTNPEMAMDQLVAIMPTGRYADIKSLGAIRWNLYMFTWSDTTPVPSVATLVGSRDITPAGTDATESWIICTASPPSDSYVVPIPNASNRVNYSGAPRARQGIAAGDRLILVNDGNNQALIQWSSNVPGDFTNFSPSKGGGQKILSSGNLLVPLNVQLWQNPQATDTLTITCKGLNGYHAAYYMAPASVSGQSDSVLIMGFEETTATPGTVSPYGVEVLNNKLYHPLEAELMASTAANYSISHKTMTTDIANKWQRLANVENIISSQHDNRLYYIVHNPEGEALEEDCMGNEIWVLDVGSDNPTWSRWLVQGIALRKLQIGNKLYMAVVKPDAIFIFDERAFLDEYAVGADTQKRAIPWRIETNTLGANKAHDAWALLYQAQLHAGDFVGEFKWGVQGIDIHGRLVRKEKITHENQVNVGFDPALGVVPDIIDLGDTNDYMEIKRDMMEWTFFASSNEVEGEVQPFYGQIDFVQFMLMQQSMNVNTELGSIETFEYRRNALNGINAVTANGVPMPIDVRRP
jgi:hypothetical protein